MPHNSRLDKFSKWLRKKYGKGKTTDKKDGNIKTVWNLPNAKIIEGFYCGSESGDMVIDYEIYGK